ncbi:helix-turn-helix domain-containing protein [Rhizobium giardinii]|nr:helix-turn-helix transcriptional regulator [Rhizobium giardinii]
MGRRIRHHRRSAGMDQRELALFIGVSAQQVQKYETGRSRVGAGRLRQIAKKLDVPVASFFEPLAASDFGVDDPAHAIDRAVLAYVSTPEGIVVNRAFQRISDPKVRRNLIGLLVAISDATYVD